MVDLYKLASGQLRVQIEVFCQFGVFYTCVRRHVSPGLVEMTTMHFDTTLRYDQHPAFMC